MEQRARLKEAKPRIATRMPWAIISALMPSQVPTQQLPAVAVGAVLQPALLYEVRGSHLVFPGAQATSATAQNAMANTDNARLEPRIG